MRCGDFPRGVIFVLPVICEFGWGYKKSAHKSGRVLILLNEVKTMTEHINQVKKLAWLIYQSKLNELAYNESVITEAMYKYAKENLQKDIDKLEKLCYT